MSVFCSFKIFFILNSLFGLMKEIDNLEIHAWHACNLTCESCSHYSALGVKGGPSLSDCDSWMANWSKLVMPKTFSILGGEPTLNKDLESILERAIYYWPNSRIQIVSNGFFLHRHPKLPFILSNARESVLVVSSHHDSIEYQSRIKPVKRLLRNWINDFGISVEIRFSDRLWTKRYEKSDKGYMLFDSNPYDAWKVCVGKKCIQLFENRLWKCPPIAYFRQVEKKFVVDESVRDLIHRYKPLEANCTMDELHAFFSIKEEEICKICPEKMEQFELQNPLRKRSI